MQKKYVEAVNILMERAKNRIEYEVCPNPKQSEIDRLYYWMLSRLHFEIEFPKKPLKVITLTIREAYVEKGTLLKSRNAEYYSGMSNKEFYEVIEEVVKLYNSADISTECVIPTDEQSKIVNAIEELYKYIEQSLS